MAKQQTEFKTVDIVDFSMQDNPTKVMDAFGHVVSSKVVDSLTNRKREVSAQMFAEKVEPEPEPTTEAEPAEEK